MKDWKTLTTDEKIAARGGRDHFENETRMDNCFHDVLSLLTGDATAIALAQKVTWGCYLINTPAEIAAYCKETATKAKLSAERRKD